MEWPVFIWGGGGGGLQQDYLIEIIAFLLLLQLSYNSQGKSLRYPTGRLIDNQKVDYSAGHLTDLSERDRRVWTLFYLNIHTGNAESVITLEVTNFVQKLQLNGLFKERFG